MAVQFSHPTMLVTLGNDGDDVVLSEAQFVIVPPLKVDYGPADGERRKLAKLAKLSITQHLAPIIVGFLPSASTFPFRDGKENL